MGEDDDSDQQLQALKAKVNSLPGPSRSSLAGPAHGRGPSGPPNRSKKGGSSTSASHQITIKLTRKATLERVSASAEATKERGAMPTPTAGETTWQVAAWTQWMKLRSSKADTEDGSRRGSGSSVKPGMPCWWLVRRKLLWEWRWRSSSLQRLRISCLVLLFSCGTAEGQHPLYFFAI